MTDEETEDVKETEKPEEAETEEPPKKTFIDWLYEQKTDDLIKLEKEIVRNVVDQYLQVTTAEATHIQWMTKVGVGAFFAVVLGMGLLTYAGKMSGESLVFLVGTIIGYLFSYMGGQRK